MHVCSWNVAGLAEDDLQEFESQVSDHYPWDILLLQEAFVRSEGIAAPSRHMLFTSGLSVGGLRRPAIFVHARWASDAATSVKLAGSGRRWVAVEFKAGCAYLFISMHLPHCRLSIEQYRDTLDEVGDILRQHRQHICILGIDANVGVEGVVDCVHVGTGVLPSCYCAGQGQRAVLLHTFLSSYGLYLCNTCLDEADANLATRANWSQTGSAQIDFIAMPLNCICDATGVDQNMSYNSDHRMVFAAVQGPARGIKRFHASLRNWEPQPSWHEAAETAAWQWENWSQVSAQWRQLASHHAKKTPKLVDEVLAGLLEERRTAPDNRQRQLNKEIWRRRRHLRRKRTQERILAAARNGQRPPSKHSNLSIDWWKMFRGRDPNQELSNFFT